MSCIYHRFTREAYPDVIRRRSAALVAHWTEELARLQPVLIVAQHRADASLVTEQLRGFAPLIVTEWAHTPETALAMAKSDSPRLVFVDQSAPCLDGLAFVRALRRSGLPCRQAPVIMMAVQPTLRDMRDAQNAGAHELLLRPFSAYQLGKRLEVIAAPRTWIETASYVGPDRRRFNSAALPAPDRRDGPAAKSASAA
jgi:CheY-like chemotaxis protein